MNILAQVTTTVNRVAMFLWEVGCGFGHRWIQCAELALVFAGLVYFARWAWKSDK